MSIKKVFLGLLCVCMTSLAWGETAGDTLWNKLSHISSMRATFAQKVTAKQRQLSKSSGVMAFERPGHFYWKTKKPMQQLLVADGKKFWVYDVDLEQVTVRPQKEIIGAAAGLFLGDDRTRFFKDFTVTEAEKDGTDVFQLAATSKSANIPRMTLRFKAFKLMGMDLYDQLGQKTAIRFQEVQTNVALSPKLFSFSPPAGVDVVEQ